jgi:hypothetical protein
MDRFTAYAQLALSMLFLTGYFLVIILFMLGHARIPTDYKEAFSGLLSLMTGGGLTVLYFWFSRARGQAPDPNTAVTTTTTATTLEPQLIGDPNANPPTLHPPVTSTVP